MVMNEIGARLRHKSLAPLRRKMRVMGAECTSSTVSRHSTSKGFTGTIQGATFRRRLPSSMGPMLDLSPSQAPKWTRTRRLFSSSASATDKLGDAEGKEVSSMNDQSLSAKNTDTLWRLVDFSKPEHSYIRWSSATLLVTSSSTLILPAASGQVLDMILTGDPSVSPALVASGLFGLTAMAGAGVYARTLWLQQAGNTLVARFKSRLYSSVLQQEMAYFDQTKTGDLLTRLSSDTSLIQSAVTTQAVASMRALVMSTGSAVMLFHTSTTLALVSLSTLPPLFLGARHVGQILRERQRTVQDLHSKAAGVAEDGLNGIRTVVQFGGQELESKRYSQAATEAHEQAVATGRTQALLDASVHVGSNGAILCVLGYGGYLVQLGSITAGDLTGFLLYSLLLAGNVSSLSGSYAEVLKAVAAADRVWEILDRQPAISAKKKSVSSPPPPLSIDDNEAFSIDFDNLEFTYPSRPEKTILGPHFSLQVPPGQVVALVGGSGSGKSTLASLLTRLYDLDRGRIRIHGTDVTDWDPHHLRTLVVGIVSQEPWLLEGSIADNILYGRPTATKEEVQEAAKAAHVWEFAQDFPQGLNTPVGGRGGTQLSGGQRQRVAIARVLLKNPPIVVLDEATSALDATSESKVQEALQTAMRGRTVISIAHRLSTIREADQIAVLENGRVVEMGTFEELSTKEDGAFFKLMGSQLL